MSLLKNNLPARLTDIEGQAFVEFALVMPVYLFMLICFVQLVLIMNAKLCLEYAAFAAARAGIVNRGNMDNMKAAAATVLAPFFSIPGLGRMSADIVSLSAMKEAVKLCITDNPDNLNPLTPVSISILNAPSPVSDYNSAASTFQLSQDQKLLKIKIDFDFPLEIPLANRIIKELSEAIVEDVSTLSGHFYKRGDYDALPVVSLRLSSTCALRLSTLTSSGS